MTPLFQYILDYFAKNNPSHAARLARWVGKESPTYFSRATSFFNRYKSYIESKGKTLDYGLDCYLKLVAHMVHEKMKFLRSGKYANSSFVEVEKQIYLNPEVFEYHMHGLVFAQFFWPDQYARFQFFSDYIGRELAQGGKYLEIGGGHALYILEATNRAPQNTDFCLLDISPSSMDLAKGITEGLRIDFRLMNIFDFASKEKFDFITLGEVIEHVEDPLSLLVKARDLLAPGGSAFISTPANSPTIDHIYLYNNADEIRAMLNEAGFKIVHERVRFAENVSQEKAEKLKVAVMFAAFVNSRD